MQAHALISTSNSLQAGGVAATTATRFTLWCKEMSLFLPHAIRLSYRFAAAGVRVDLSCAHAGEVYRPHQLPAEELISFKTAAERWQMS